MFCRKCGKEIPDDSEFCNKCRTPTGVQPVASENSKLWDYNDAGAAIHITRPPVVLPAQNAELRWGT